MSEFIFIPKSRKYLEKFIKSKINDYKEARVEFNPHKGYGNYKNNYEILGCLDSIIGYFEDKFFDTSIPEHFSSVDQLIDEADKFSKWIKSTSEKYFNEAIAAYADDEIPTPIIEIKKFRDETIAVFTEFIRLSKLELKENENPSLNESLEGIDIRKYKPKAIWNFLKNCTWYSHVLIWGAFVSFASGYTYFYNKITKDENLETKNEQIEKLLSDTKSQLYAKQSTVDSLLNLPLKEIHDTLIVKPDTVITKSEKLNTSKTLYSVTQSNIKAGTAFNDKIIGVSITLSNITIDYTATAIYDIPEPFGTVKVNNKGIIVSAGKFWKFKKNNKNYKLVISKIDYVNSTYGIELFELDRI